MYQVQPDTLPVSSLTSMNVEDLLVMAFSPISSHILDAALTSPNVEFKWRRKLLMAFMGHYLELAQDKLGSRVADTIWDRAADGFTKVSSKQGIPCRCHPWLQLTDPGFPFALPQEKIARSLIDHHNTLSQSQYGKYFARKLNLPLLQRRPAEWKELQLGVVHHFLGSRLPDKAGSSANPQGFMGGHSQQDGKAGDAEAKKSSKKRKNKMDDETAVIDDLFADVTEKKSKKVKA